MVSRQDSQGQEAFIHSGCKGLAGGQEGLREVPGLGAQRKAGALGGFPRECQLSWEVKVDGAPTNQAKSWGSVPEEG